MDILTDQTTVDKPADDGVDPVPRVRPIDDPAWRHRRAVRAARARWDKFSGDRLAATAPGLLAAEARYDAMVHPSITGEERARRAVALRQIHYQRINLASREAALKRPARRAGQKGNRGDDQ